MPFSHHSHSGEFCSHGKDTLEEIVQAAIFKEMDVFALTEHMPREQSDLYPEELKEGMTQTTLAEKFDGYYHEAVRLRERYAGQIKLLVGMEVDWIRPSSQQFIEDLQRKYQLDLFIGSVHHVHGIPTDYNRELYTAAIEMSGAMVGGDERIFEDYFDLQLDMLEKLKPPIVGHFDVIRLWSSDRDGSFARYDGVWRKVLRNLDAIAKYGGVLEINSAALRKGMKEPYPKAEICQEFLAKGGQFTLSDDSHGIAQIATHYAQTFAFLEKTGIDNLVCFERSAHDSSRQDRQCPRLTTKVVNLTALKAHSLFQ